MTKMRLDEYGYCAVELYFSAACNLKCRYCFQPSVPEHMHRVNEEIREWISSGRMREDILTYVGPNIRYISLWGGEPTINLPLLTEQLESFLDSFPNLNEIMFSTNLSTKALAQNVVDFTLRLDKYCKDRGRNILFKNQISLDGAPFINDKNRIGATAEGILDNVMYLLEKTQGHRTFCSAHFKPTVASDGLAVLSKEENLVKNYQFFDDFYYRVKTEFPNEKAFPRGAESITIACPGDYTPEDGKNLLEYTKIQMCPDFLDQFRMKNILTNKNQLTTAFYRFIDTLQRTQRRPFKIELSSCISCSIGKTMFGLDHKKNFHVCHHDFFLDDDMMEYLERTGMTSEFTEKIGYDFKLYNARIRKVTKFNFETDSEAKKMQVLSTLSQGAWEPYNRYQYNLFILKELALSGQISEIFLKDERMLDLAAAFWEYGHLACPINNLWETGHITMGGISHARILFNGFFEYMISTVEPMRQKYKEIPELYERYFR